MWTFYFVKAKLVDYKGNTPKLMVPVRIVPKAPNVVMPIVATQTSALIGLAKRQPFYQTATVGRNTLKVNTTVTRVELWQKQIGDADARAIAETLKVNKTVTCIGLGENQIGDAGASAIAKALKVNTTVTTVDLGQNLIGDAGAQAIAEALRVNTTLTRLNLSCNYIGDVGIQAIADAHEFNSTQINLTIGNQSNPLVLSLLPRLATADDLQAVFGLLTSGPELENQLASLPALPTEMADLIMDEACYGQGARRTRPGLYNVRSMQVTVPRSSTANSTRVKAIQALLGIKHVWDNNPEPYVVELIVRDEQGAVRYECTAQPTLVNSTLRCVTILPAVLRQMREGWRVDLRPSIYVPFLSFYFGYI